MLQHTRQTKKPRDRIRFQVLIFFITSLNLCNHTVSTRKTSVMMMYIENNKLFIAMYYPTSDNSTRKSGLAAF